MSGRAGFAPRKQYFPLSEAALMLEVQSSAAIHIYWFQDHGEGSPVTRSAPCWMRSLTVIQAVDPESTTETKTRSRDAEKARLRAVAFSSAGQALRVAGETRMTALILRELPRRTVSYNPVQVRKTFTKLRDQIAPFVFARDNDACRQCGSVSDLQVDHIVPVKCGGSNNVANLQTLCGPCNRKKGARAAKLDQELVDLRTWVEGSSVLRPLIGGGARAIPGAATRAAQFRTCIRVVNRHQNWVTGAAATAQIVIAIARIADGTSSGSTGWSTS